MKNHDIITLRCVIQKINICIVAKKSQFTGVLVYLLLDGFHMLELPLLLNISLHCCISNLYLCNMCNCFSSGSNISDYPLSVVHVRFSFSLPCFKHPWWWNEGLCDLSEGLGI